MNHFISMQDLKDMKHVDLRNVDCNKLVDISNIKIDETAPVSDRVFQFIEQIGNPYCFKVGNVAVKVSYQEEGESFQKRFEEMLALL